ncbi:Jerky protein-like-like [Holothuria leucospilota]|uniref:Jerky protein-like-like n=1 Tax=Holothuria leucospilota TaxID=206669 RepID=A0A9Q1BG56_HOLLE|nr:Jerky protein-like-like [Holothuria leucospilota]
MVRIKTSPASEIRPATRHSTKMRQKQHNPRKVNRRSIFKKSYNLENVMAAYSLVKSDGISIRKAAEKTNVPFTTLHDKLRGKNQIGSKWGRKSVLSKEEERKLVEHLTQQAKFGYGITVKTVRNIASDILRTRSSKNERRLLTNGWFQGFMRRWPCLKVRKPQRLNMNRATASSEETVKKYFEELEAILRKYKLQDRPDLIYNVDETGFQTEHTPPRVVTTKSTALNSLSSPRSATTTVLVTTNAIGNALPPYFVFKGKRRNEDLMKGALPGSSYAMTDSGWSNSEVFFDYLKNHFLKYVRPSGTQKVILLYDGHASHMSIPLIEYARENGVVLFVLPAHTSHILQPLDVGCFGPYKKAYDQECYHFLRRHPGQVISRYDMCQLLSNAHIKAMTPTNICHSFRKCGIYPFNPAQINIDAYQPAKGLEQLSTGPTSETTELTDLDIDGILSKYSTNNKSKPKKKRRRKMQYRAAGVAITETSILLKLKKVQEEREQSGAKVRRALKFTKECADAASVTSEPGSRPGCSGNTNVVEELNSSDSQEDDNCCFCGRWAPPKLKTIPGVTFVEWAKCDICPHWTHLKFCTKVSEVRKEDTFLCPHCLEE